MKSNYSDGSLTEKWKHVLSSIMRKNLPYSAISEKYFRAKISASTTKAIEGNWIRLLGGDYQYICANLYKFNNSFGISLDVKTYSSDNNQLQRRHFIRTILPRFCIEQSNLFKKGDEILEINGQKIPGLSRNDVIRIIRKVPVYFQIVVARKNVEVEEDAENILHVESQEIDGYDDDDVASRCSTLRSTASNYSTTSRDFSLSVSVDDLMDDNPESIREFLKGINGWRGPVIIEFRKKRETLGVSLEEILDPRNNMKVVVFKYIVPNMKAGTDGRIQKGDRILEINGKSIDKVPFRKVCQWMKYAPRGRLILSICKPHFKPIGFDNLLLSNDDIYHNSSYKYKSLPRLIEEGSRTEEQFDDDIEVPPVSENLEQHIRIKKDGNLSLGLYFEVVDGGKHGCKVKKIVDGLAKREGTIQEGDYVTSINGVNWRISNNTMLNYYIKKINVDQSAEYRVTIVTAADVQMHKNRYLTTARKRRLSFKNPIMPVTLSDSDLAYDQDGAQCIPYETYIIHIINKQKSNLGLILAPSVTDPSRYLCITEITPKSLAEIDGQLKINDYIITVNEQAFQYIGIEAAGETLKRLLETEDELVFKIRRLINDEGEENTPDFQFKNHYPELEKLPDFYLCILQKDKSYGFSVAQLENGLGVVVDVIEPDSPAYQSGLLKSGDRFIMINNVYVNGGASSTIQQLVKGSKTTLGLIMERPKYLEFTVQLSKTNPTHSFGLNIAGGTDIGLLPCVDSLDVNTTSVYSRGIMAGDFIIEIDSCPIIEYTHDEVIQYFRSLGSKCTLRVRRQLKYQNRYLRDYLEGDYDEIRGEECLLRQYLRKYSQEIRLVKTVNDDSEVPQDYGIYFDDVIIENPVDHSVVEKFKIMSTLIKDSIAYNSIPDSLRTCNMYLYKISDKPIDVNFDNNFIKECIESHQHEVVLEVVLDLPYNTILNMVNAKNKEADIVNDDERECDSPVILSKKSSVQSTDSDNDKSETKLNEQSEKSELPVLTRSENVDEEEEEEGEDKISEPDSVIQSDKIVQPVLDDEQEDGAGDTKPNGDDNDDDVIDLDEILIDRIPGKVWGLQLFGGGGDLPIYVKNVERDSCCWPKESEKPLLMRRDQILQLNGEPLQNVTVDAVQAMLDESSVSQMRFKIVRLH